MEIKQLKQVEVVTDVVCDVCNQSTKLEFGNLSAHWGYGSKHDGEKYELQLCENIAPLKSGTKHLKTARLNAIAFSRTSLVQKCAARRKLL